MAQPVKLDKFKGITNRYARHALPRGDDGAALWAAENVDIDLTGRLSRRGGFTLETALTAGDSLWSDGRNLYYRDNGQLYRDQVSLVSVSGRVSYDAFPGGGVIFTDSADLKFISTAGAVSYLAPGTPSAPSLASTSGTLQPATYLVSITSKDADGVESAASAFDDITLAAAGGVTVTLPTLPQGATGFNVYVSGPNGEAPTLHGTTSSATYTINDYADGRALATQDLARMPAGTIARVSNGRLLVAVGAALFSSEAYNFGLYNPAEGFLLFPGTITIVAPMQNGVFVVADKTYWLAGSDVRKSEFFERLPYGGIAGSDARHPTSESAYWKSTKGLVVADTEGAVKNVQEAALSITSTASRGATIVLADNDRIVVSDNG
jgi:hypothetical protein